MKRACPGLSIEDQKNYDLPFEKNQSRCGTVCFPNLLEPLYSEKIEFFNNIKKYWTSQKPKKTCIVWGMNDPVMWKLRRRTSRLLPQAKVVKTQAGHFVQEETPAEVITAIKEIFK